MTSEVRVPKVPAVAVDFGTTRHVLAAHRRHASHLLFIGLGIMVIAVVLVTVGAVPGRKPISSGSILPCAHPSPFTSGSMDK